VLGKKWFALLASQTSATTPSAAETDRLAKATTTRLERELLYTQVSAEGSLAGSWTIDGTDPSESLARARAAQIAARRHLLDMAVLDLSLLRIKQQAAYEKREGWVRRTTLTWRAILASVGSLALAAGWAWEFIDSLNHHYPILSSVAYVVGGACSGALAGAYTASRLGKSRPGPHEITPDSDETALDALQRPSPPVGV
jgi:hypothetical protein